MYVCEGMKGENPHFQGYFESVINQRTLRSQIVKIAGKGNGKYSLKESDEKPIEYLAYLKKEDPSPVMFGFSQEVLDEVDVHDEQVKKEMKDKKEKKEAKKLNYDQLKDYIDSFFYADTHEGQGRPYPRLKQVVRIVADYFTEKKMMFIPSNISRLSVTYLTRRDPTFLEEMCEKITTDLTYTRR